MPRPRAPQPTVFEGTGGQANAALKQFRAAIGGDDNGDTPTPQPDGRREIDWDGVLLNGTDFGGTTTTIVANKIVGIPVDRFQTRGVILDEVYAVSDDSFASANKGAAGQFPPFSPKNVFAMFDDNDIELSFVLPSLPSTLPVPGKARGFGAIFLDVETPKTSSIEFFNGPVSLGRFFVPPAQSGKPSFLGVLFPKPVITDVRLLVGTAEIFSLPVRTPVSGPPDRPGKAEDLAATDDFVFSEPVKAEPPLDVTLQLDIFTTSRARDEAEVCMRNVSGESISGRLFLVIDELINGIVVSPKPTRSSDDGAFVRLEEKSLAQGEQLCIPLRFKRNDPDLAINFAFTAKVLAFQD